MKFWHDLEKTIPAEVGMTVAVAEGIFVHNGKEIDAVQPDPVRRPKVTAFGFLDFHHHRNKNFLIYMKSAEARDD